MPTTITITAPDSGPVTVSIAADGQPAQHMQAQSLTDALEQVEQAIGAQDDEGAEAQGEESAEDGQGMPDAQSMWDQEAAKRSQASPGM